MARSLRMVLLAWVAVVGVVTVAVPLAAQAAEMDKNAKADAKEAMRFYKEGNYDDAAKIFLKLSIAYPDMVVFVRNLGACYYYMRRFEPALSNLRDYIHSKKDIAPDDRAEVEGWISEMERLRDKAATATLVPAAAPLPAAPTTPSAPPAQAPGVVEPAATPGPSGASSGNSPVGSQPGYPQAPYGYPPSQGSPPPNYPPGYETAPYAGVATPAPASQPSSGSARKTVAWILGVVGLGSAIAGTYCTVMALDRYSKVEKKYDPSVEKEGNTFAKAQWVGYGVGAALITTAIIVGASGGGSSGIAFAPAVGPGGAGAVMSGSF
jgi:hypothetical protein